MARVIDEREFADLIRANSPKPLVVDCYTDWCPPCKTAAPIYEQLSQKYQDHADFIKINVDKNQGVAAKLRIRGVPTFVIIIGNRLVSKIVGADMRKLEKEIMRIIEKKN